MCMFEGKNILIVEDDATNALALSAILRSKKPNVFIAYNGLECLDHLNLNPDVNLILLDLMMPEMDGYETLSRIRSNAKTSHIPVIVVTARVAHGEREKCIMCGADAYITKPLEYEELITQIKRLCF